MTVVALLFADTFPVAITDNLISNRVAELDPINTPITVIESRGGMNGFYPAGLAKKHWKSKGGEHYLLYAGTVQDAQILFDFIESKSIYGPYDKYTHVRVVEYAQCKNLDLSFIVVSLSSDGYVEHHYYRADLINNTKFGKVLILGSGKEELIRELAEFSRSNGIDLPVLSLQSSEEYSSTLINAIALNSLALMAQLTINYASAESELAKRSAGGHFNLLYFPELYGWNISDPFPPLFQGVSQLHLFVNETGVVANRFIHAELAWGSSPARVLSFSGEVRMDVDSFLLSAESVLSYSIEDFRDKTKFGPISENIKLFSNQLIVFVARKFPDGKYKAIFMPYACSGLNLVTIIRSSGGRVKIEVKSGLLEGLIDRSLQK